MTRIGLLSDTHGYIDEKILNFFKECDQIWHAGDIGSLAVVQELTKIAPVQAVYGNIDSFEIRSYFPEIKRFTCEEMKVVIIHIGGYPGHYQPVVREIMKNNPPDIFISGHSHILKVMFDKKFNCLHINPGAYGKNGFHNVRTAMRFVIEKKNARDMEIMELDRNTQL